MSKNIIIAGDVTMDWNLARIHKAADKGITWTPEIRSSLSWQRGGAALLADVITQLAAELESTNGQQYSIFHSKTPTSPVDPNDPGFHHSYSIWSLSSDQNKKAWRVAEFLGLDRSKPDGEIPPSWMQTANVPEKAEVVILDDAGLGFRDHPEIWPKCISTSDQKTWVLLKMSQPVGQGLLFDHLTKNFADRLIILTTASDFRLTDVQISKGLSWERTAQDLIWELGPKQPA